MHDSTLVFGTETLDGTELVVNFGVHAGREATPAELERLGHALLDRIDGVTVVSEVRYRFGREAEAALHQLRIQLPPGAHPSVLQMVEEWAQDCIRERSLLD